MDDYINKQDTNFFVIKLNKVTSSGLNFLSQQQPMIVNNQGGAQSQDLHEAFCREV